MSQLSRRLLGVCLLAVSLLVSTQPLALRRVSDATVPVLADPASYLAVLPPAALSAGATLFVAGVAAVRGRPVGTLAALSAPAVASAAGLLLILVDAGAAAGADAAALTVETVAALVTGVPAGFLLSGAAVGGAVAPVVLGSVKEDTAALLVGAVVLLAAIALSPVPAAAGVTGLLGGGVAVAALWTVDAEGWRP